jgi:hypothetical protein
VTASSKDLPHDSDIQLSVVACSRNDNHGGSLTARTQHFIDGFVAQCKRHGLRAELILVEWNPPADRVPLRKELRWPSDSGPCDIRIITVPSEVHQTFSHADKIPLFQMIAKNVGIRRARGRFVLATNIDILFSDGVIRFMRDRLRPGVLYRTARADIPAKVPSGGNFSKVLQFCESEAFRIHGRAITVVRRSAQWSSRDLWLASLDARAVFALRVIGFGPKMAKLLLRPRELARSLIRLALGVGREYPLPSFTRSKMTLSLVWYVCTGVTRRVIQATPIVARRLTVGSPFTNACGDFTLLSRQDWFSLRGYAEWPLFSWHLDSVLVHQALAAGLKEKRLGADQRVFHIEHGRGYRPEAAAELFSRLSESGVPFLSDADLERARKELKANSKRGAARYNDEAWGLSTVSLPEAAPAHPLNSPSSRSAVGADALS